MKKSISFYTLGCRSNQSETAVLRNLFEQRGYRVLAEDSSSDLAVINTCTVTEKGDRDTLKLIHRLKKINANMKIALIGCQAQTQGEELKRLSGVHWIVGNAQKMDLVALIEKRRPGRQAHLITPPIPQKTFTVPGAGIEEQRTRANLKVQDGCQSFCTYCEVPYARGPARSRDFDDIFKEAGELVHAGHKELVLTGINIGAYQDNGRTLLDVVKMLEEFDGLERIRISSIEPQMIPPDLVLLMGTKTKLCRYLHLPLQSMSDRILELMGRSYISDEIDLFLEFATQNVSGICIGADVIVGFPGETEDDFNDTYEFLAQSSVNYLHVFSYSDRKFAQSRQFPNHIDRTTIRTRSAILRQLSARKKNEFLRSSLGTTAKVLFEEKKKGGWMGLTDNYIRVKVVSSKDLHNQILPVRLEELLDDVVLGSLNP